MKTAEEWIEENFGEIDGGWVKDIQIDAEKSMRQRAAEKVLALLGARKQLAGVIHDAIMNLPSEVTAENIQGMEE